MAGLVRAWWGRLTPALTLAGIVAFSGWNCDDVRFRRVAQETAAVESDAAGQAVGAAEEKIPDLGERIERLIFDWLGLVGLIAIVIVLFVARGARWLWWNWDEILQKPFVSKIFSRPQPAPLPPADPARFTVAIATCKMTTSKSRRN